MGWLSLAIWTPIVFGVLLLALGRDDQAPLVRWIALIGSILAFGLTELAVRTHVLDDWLLPARSRHYRDHRT